MREQRTCGIHVIIDGLLVMTCDIDDKNDVSFESDQIILLDEVDIRFLQYHGNKRKMDDE